MQEHYQADHTTENTGLSVSIFFDIRRCKQQHHVLRLFDEACPTSGTVQRPEVTPWCKTATRQRRKLRQRLCRRHAGRLSHVPRCLEHREGLFQLRSLLLHGATGNYQETGSAAICHDCRCFRPQPSSRRRNQRRWRRCFRKVRKQGNLTNCVPKAADVLDKFCSQ